MKNMNGQFRSRYYGLAGFLSVLSFVVFAAAPAQATNCPPENLRWAHSSNRIYVSGSVVCTLTEIEQSISVYAPLELVSPEQKIWFLGANLIIENGAKVLLHGSAIGGDVDELRLKSNNSSDTNNFVFIRAQWGELEINNTRITSWNEASSAPDEEYDVFGRAFIHVRSFLETDGVTARESRMDIIESDVGYLGYYAAESYGLVWKVYGTQVDLYDKVDVYGDIRDSTIHHNYMGMYSYGAYAMNIVNNEFYENVQYGVNTHDDSDWLVIEGNYSHHNGNHGIICSQRCDNLIIRNNRSSYNDGHGIMLHRSVVASVVEKNEVLGNSGAGIALFESHNNIVQNNVVDGNTWGIRLSVGSKDNQVISNNISNQVKHGIFSYKGSDAPETSDGFIRDNYFAGNIITGSREFAVNMLESIGNVFEANTFSNNQKGVSISVNSSSNNFIGNVFENISGKNYAINLTGGAGTVVQSNQFLGTGNGLYFKNSTNGLVDNNVINMNCEYGIRLDTSTLNEVSGNTVSGRCKIGVDINSSDNNAIEGNRVENADKGIQLRNGSKDNYVVKNTLVNNIYGIYFENAGLNVVEDNIFQGNLRDTN